MTSCLHVANMFVSFCQNIDAAAFHHYCLLWKYAHGLIVLRDLTPASAHEVNTLRAVAAGEKSFHRSASRRSSYYCSLEQPPLEAGVCGDGVKKRLTICCTSERGAKNGFKIVGGVSCRDWALVLSVLNVTHNVRDVQRMLLVRSVCVDDAAANVAVKQGTVQHASVFITKRNISDLNIYAS